MNKKKKYLTFLNKVRNKLIHPFEKNIGNYFIHKLPGNFFKFNYINVQNSIKTCTTK